MNIEGEMYVVLRDTLIKTGIGERYAQYIAYQQLEGLRREGLIFAGQTSGLAYKALGTEVSRRVEQYIAPLVAEARQALELEGVDLAVVADSRAHDARQAALSLFVKVLGANLPSVAKWWSLSLLAGVKGLTNASPLLLQERPGGPARLYYWVTAANLADWAMAVFLDRGKQPPDPLDDLDFLLPSLGNFAASQWRIAGIVGLLQGRDGIEWAWIPYAQARMKAARRRVIALLENFTHEAWESFLSWQFAEEAQPTPELDLVGEVTRHILYRAPLHVPALGRAEILRIAGQEERVIGTRIILNHPLVPLARLQEEVRAARLDFGHRQYPLSAEDERFLALVHEMNEKPDRRLPKGFWEKFQARWAEQNPQEPPPSISCLRVRWHRLKKRINPS